MAVALALALCVAGAFACMAAPAERAWAAPPAANQGDPKANGDLYWSDYFQSYVLAGFRATLYETPDGGGYDDVPFEYPAFLTASNAAGKGNFKGWGYSNFAYSYVDIANKRSIEVSALPDRGHCCQSNNDTTTSAPHVAVLVLDETESGWDASHAVYHGVFVLYVNNEVGSGTGDEYDQATVGWAKVEGYWRAYGSLDIAKVSANDSITKGNGCYTLAGARYAVSRADDGEACDTLVTDASGKARSKPLPVGTYTVRETEPPSGYRLDASTYTVEIEAGGVAHVNGGSVADAPAGQPVEALVSKVDAQTGGSAQGNASLAGARFAVKYYANMDGDASGEPTRSWVFETDAAGRAAFDESHLVSGDPFYLDTGYPGATGRPILPRGTVTIREIAAPEGYNLDDGCGGPAPTATSLVTGDDPVTLVAGNSQADSVQRGDFRVIKSGEVDFDGNDPQRPESVLVAGIRFQIINASAAPVVSPEDGKTKIAPGGVVCTIVTDENGYASTRSGKEVNGWSVPKGWSGALACGTYGVHEVIPPAVQADYRERHGTELLAAPDWRMSIPREGCYAPAALVEDKIPQTPLKIVKVDSESGLPVRGICSFRLLDANGDAVVHTARYPEERSEEVWTTNADGEVMLPLMLKQGTYRVQEVSAPRGYALGEETISFGVPAEYRTWDDPLVVEFADAPLRGSIEIAKSDGAGSPLAGACYAVQAAEDIVTLDGEVHAVRGQVVANLTTDAAGAARADGLYLGSYDVYEVKAPQGYAVDPETHRVEVGACAEGPQKVGARCSFSNEPTTFRLKKVDSAAGTPLPGAVFRIWTDDGAYDERVATDGAGVLEVSRLAPGTYHVHEEESPAGYWADGSQSRDFSFTVDERGLITSRERGIASGSSLEIERSNAPVSLGTTATVNGGHEGTLGTNVRLVDVVEYHGCVPGESYTVQGSLHRAVEDDDGAMKDGGEIAGSDGEPVTANATFEAEQAEGAVEVVFEFDSTAMEGASVVAFEEMFHGDELFASHADIDDEGQTVVFPVAVGVPAPKGPKPPVPETELAQTGDELLRLANPIALAAAGSLALCAHAVRRPRRLLRRRSLSVPRPSGVDK